MRFPSALPRGIRCCALPIIALFVALFTALFTHGAVQGETLRVVIYGDIRGLNPGVTRDGDTDTVHQHLFESLVAYDEALHVQLMLADTLSVSEDGRRYTFQLRGGIEFHNGAILTADHVVWNWRRMLDPATGWRCRSWYDGSAAEGVEILDVSAPDDRNVVFELRQASGVFLDRMAHVQCFTAILHPDSVNAEGEIVEPVGTGPYRLREWRRGEYIELERHAGYRARHEPKSGYAGGKTAETALLRFMIIPDPAIALAALLSGDIDVLPRIPLHLVGELERAATINTVSAAQLFWSVLLMQSRDPLLADRRVRQALAHAISIDQVAAVVTFDTARENPSAVPRASRFHTAAHERRVAYDPARARRLLDEAGYDGRVLRLQANRKNAFMFDAAIAVQAMLLDVGVEVELEVLDWATQLANYYNGEFQLMSFGYSGRTHPVLNYAMFLGDKAANPAYQWADAEALRLLAGAAGRSDDVDKQRYFDQLHHLMLEQVPILGLYNQHQVDAVRADIEGYRAWALGSPRLWNVKKVQPAVPQ